MQKKFALFSSFIIMLCLGSIYAWSIFVPELKQVYHLTTAQTQLIFGTVITVFTITMIWAAHIYKKLGAKFVASISGILYFTGYLIAFLSKGNFFILWFGIGIIGGMGTGMGYLVSLTVPVKWYPNKKGFVTGIVVAGFGAGAIILTYLAVIFINRGVNVLSIFLLQGIVYGLLILLAANKLNNPQQIHHVKEILPGTQKRGVYIFQLIMGIFAGTFTGLLVIGNLKPIANLQNINNHIIPLTISLFALANFSGRISWGWLSDKISTGYLIPVALILQAAASVALFFVQGSNILFVFVVLIIGFSFGANFVLFAKETISKFGIQNYDRIYPYIFLGYGFAGIAGPFTGGKFFDLTGSYLHAINFAFVLSFVASVIFVLIHFRYASNNTTGLKRAFTSWVFRAANKSGLFNFRAELLKKP